MVKITKKIIETLKADAYKFINENDLETIIAMAKYAAKKYYNKESTISDAIYDLLIDKIKKEDPNNKLLTQVGSEIMSKEKVKLPYYMGSMNKIKPSDLKEFTWKDTYTGPYVYSDKLDGVSGLLINTDGKLHLYKRGNGYEGTDISKIIPYIHNIKTIKLKNNNAVRGELIISKKNFELFKDKYENARNMVSGLTGSKYVDVEPTSYIDFVVYELINPWITKQSEQFDKLANMGFEVAYNKKLPKTNLTFENLSTILKDRKQKSDYIVDGIVVSNDELPTDRTIGENPKYAFAFKDESLMEKANIEVINVNWEISKDGYIKPTLNLVPTKLAGVTISSVTAFNAKYVKENKLGPGAVVELMRSGDVIPDIQRIIKPAKEAQLPQNIDYEWTSSGVDIITTKKTINQQIKELTFFFKTLNIKYIDEATVQKLFDAGINTIPKIITITQDKLNNIEGFKEKSINRIYDAISTRIKTLNILDLMVASNLFGHGMGKRKITQVLKVYPNVITLYSENSYENIINKIIEIDGFDTKTATLFANGLTKFIELYNSLDTNIRKQLRTSIVEIKTKKTQDCLNIFDNNIFVFSGFRNIEWEKIIEKNCGKVTNSVSSKTNILISNQQDIDNNSNAKIVKAKQLNVKIMNKEDFEKEYINKIDK